MDTLVAVTISGISVGDRRLLHDIAFSLDGGSVLLVKGPVGCGKSTLLRAMGGLAAGVDITGSIRYLPNGRNLEAVGAKPTALVGLVGLLQQDPSVNFATTTVRDELIFSLECVGLCDDDLTRSLDRLPFPSKVGALIGRDLDQLSEGEKQVVGLAAVSALNVPVILLDEPTAMLDEEGIESFVTYLQALVATKRHAIVIATHNPELFTTLSTIVLDLEAVIVPSAMGYSNASAPVDQWLSKLALTLGGGAVVKDLQVETEAKGILVRDGTMNLGEGEFILLSGGNGTGKSLIAVTLAGIAPKKSSGVKVGVTVSSSSGDLRTADELGSFFGLVFQSPRYRFLGTTVTEELSIATYDDVHLSEADYEGWQAFLQAEFTDFGVPLTMGPRELSYGQQKALMCAVQVPPRPVLIIDEPHLAAGHFGRRMFERTVGALRRAGGTCLILTHDPTPFISMASRRYEISGQRIIQLA